ncbi:ArsC/Spx/MgsR family protein [Lactococcus garvieae]|uniref:ArsC/Spx/MgsR family protein n=1 Tax=Lactococcus garvieae TaxID=1363 RepID=UPI003246CE5F
MICIFYRGSCNSSKKTISWLEHYGVKVEKKRMSQLTAEDLIKILSLSDEGLDAVIKRSGRIGYKNRKTCALLESMNFGEAIHYLLDNLDLLQSPLVLEGSKLMIGFNEDEIRKFLPKRYRRLKVLQ